jgi:hypothetical protein
MSRKPSPDITKTCQQCGSEYTRPNWKVWRASIYCSYDCYTAQRHTLTPDQRTALMAEATSRIRGSKRSHDDLCKRAQTKQARAVLSGDEAVIMAGFIAIDLNPVPLFAVDKFNVDFAFPDALVAIEYHGGNWHNTTRKRAQDERKRQFLESIGWTVRAFPRIDKPQANDAGNERIAVSDLVREVAALVHHHDQS